MFVWYVILGLLIVIFWVLKNSYYKEVVKFGIMFVLFNIGELVMYGLFIVLNFILFILFLLCFVVMFSVVYLVIDFKLGFFSNIKCNLGNIIGFIWIFFDRIWLEINYFINY